MKRTILKLVVVLLSLFLFSCGGGQKQNKWQKNPVDNLIRDMDQVPSYSIILYDMDAEGNFSKTYKHQYKIITMKDSVPEQVISEWQTVPEQFFMKHKEHMGMEIVAKADDGTISKTPAPPGYSNYVGNERYGNWRSNGSGGSYWEFYGKYMFFSSMFNMVAFPAYRNNYMDYRSNYRGSRPYYGSTRTGSRMFGTNSSYSQKTRSNSRWSKSSNRSSFKSGSNQTTRSGSRYSSGVSSRSRSGGFGK